MLALRAALGRCLAGPARGGAAVLGGDGTGEACGELGPRSRGPRERERKERLGS